MTQTVGNDSTVLLVLAAAVALLTVAMETLARRGVFPQWLCRKVLHLGAVGACAAAPVLLADLTALTVIVAVATVLLFFLVGKGQLFLEADGRPSWGIALFPVPYLALLLLFPSPEQRWLIALPMGILALSDALAGVVGTLLRTPSFTLTGDRKTLGGSLTFVVCTWALLVTLPGPLESLEPAQRHATALLFALLLAAVEALGSRGRDNLYIPAAAAMLLFGHPASGYANGSIGGVMPALIALPATVLFVVLTVRQRWLTLGGGVAAALLGLWVIHFQGLPWLLPLAVFLASGSLLGKLRRARSASSDPKHGQPRDPAQVFANGGIYGLAAALLPSPQAQVAMALCLSTAAADTWASEIGIALKGRTVDLVRLRPVPVGLSGGVSVGGSVGAAAGAVVLAAVGVALLPDLRSLLLLIQVASLGFAGMVVDSLLGSILQAKYRGPSGLLQDTATDGARHVAGLRWMTNDAVNLLSTTLITGLGAWWLT